VGPAPEAPWEYTTSGHLTVVGYLVCGTGGDNVYCSTLRPATRSSTSGSAAVTPPASVGDRLLLAVEGDSERP
jgi:hypothetical protein